MKNANQFKFDKKYENAYFNYISRVKRICGKYKLGFPEMIRT